MPQKFRYEFYLPKCYNDGKKIEPRKFRQVRNIIREKFRGISIHPGTISGEWIDSINNQLYKDTLIRFEVTVDGSVTNQLFFEDLKEKLKRLFEQHEIYILYTPITQV